MFYILKIIMFITIIILHAWRFCKKYSRPNPCCQSAYWLCRMLMRVVFNWSYTARMRRLHWSYKEIRLGVLSYGTLLNFVAVSLKESILVCTLAGRRLFQVVQQDGITDIDLCKYWQQNRIFQVLPKCRIFLQSFLFALSFKLGSLIV